MVKKERLKNKGKVDGPLILKERKFRIKQKTDCHNQEYLDFLKRKKAVVNWVKFNITEGIYLLSNRVNNIMSIDKIKKNSQIETLEQKVQ